MSTVESSLDLFDAGPRVTSRDPLTVLRDVFGHRSFRGQQSDVDDHVVTGGDAVVLFPSGAG